MRKFLSGGLVVFAGMVSVPSPLSHLRLADRVGEETAEPPKMDPRLASLKEFFERRNCPALAVADVFVRVADTYDLDWRLLPSISFVESTGGKNARNNNLFGWDAGRAEFGSLTAAVERVAYSLANSNIYKNKDLDGILETYNPDVEYARKVKSVMERIAPTE